MPADAEVQMPSSKDRRRLEVPAYLHEQLRQIAARESRTVASVASELILVALRDRRPRWIPNEHLPLFNGRARRVLDLANEEALSFDHTYIGTEHLLLGLLREDQGSAAQYLASRGIELEKVREAVSHHIGRGDRPVSGELEYTPRTRSALALTVDGAQSLGHDRIGTEHILLGLAREGQGIAAGILERMGIDLEGLRQRRLSLLSQLD
jgi:ATP-dependent Clp protease ATP-binding subunit ClpC